LHLRDCVPAARKGDTLHLFVSAPWRKYLAHLSVFWGRGQIRTRRIAFWEREDYSLIAEVSA